MKIIHDLLEGSTGMTPKVLNDVHGRSGEHRANILFDRIDKGQPVHLLNNKEVIIDPVKSAAAMEILAHEDRSHLNKFAGGNRSAIKFYDKDGNAYPLNMLIKADYLGGGKGSGGGAEQTAAQEAAQAVACAIGSVSGNHPQIVEDLNQENMVKSQHRFKIATPGPKILEMFQYGTWPNTFVNSTNALFNSFPKSSKMIFHHASPWVKRLEAIFNKINNAEGKYFSNINKWNPSDIWATSPAAPLPGRETETLVGLNKWLQDAFQNGEVYGISLKAAPKKATATKINYHGDPKDILNVAVKRLLTTKTNNLFGSKDAYIVYEGDTMIGDFDHLRAIVEDNEIQFRSFGGDDSIQGEIKGKHAAHGKIGNGGINAILKKFKLKQLTPRKKIIEQSERNIEKLVDQIIKKAHTVSPVAAKEAKEAFMSIADDMKMNMLVSKYQSVETLANIKEGTTQQQNKVLQEILGYAASQSELSSVYIKIS